MVLTTADITEITERHRRVDADPRFTDKIAHRDRRLLLDHIASLNGERLELFENCRELITDNDGNLRLAIMSSYWEQVGEATLKSLNDLLR